MPDPSNSLGDDARPLHGRLAVPLLLVLAGIVALSIDLPTWRMFSRPSHSLVGQIVETGEAFGHAVGVLFILVAVAVLDPLRRPMLYRLAACSWGAGLVANLGKMSISRTRPHRFDLASSDVFATFNGWFPLFTSDYGDKSCPSAHTATAFGLAIALASLYPRGRVMFVAFAALCALQRVQCGAHYVSDVCWGAAVGWAWAAACLASTPLAAGFDRLESPTYDDAPRGATT